MTTPARLQALMAIEALTIAAIHMSAVARLSRGTTQIAARRDAKCCWTLQLRIAEASRLKLRTSTTAEASKLRLDFGEDGL